MSRENLEVVERFLWAFENDTEAFRDTCHAEIEWRPFEEDHTPSHGVEGAMRIRNEWLGSWDQHQVDLQELVEEGDSVVASVHLRARGKASGVEVDTWLYPQFKLRDGKVVYLFEHLDREAALEAAAPR